MIESLPVPKGKLLIIGGHEEKLFTGDPDSTLRKALNVPHFDILSRLIDKVPHTHNVIEIIATASSIPAEMEEIYQNAYKGAGYSYVSFMRIENSDAANNPDFVKRVHYAHAVFFTGGDQRKLTTVLNDSDVLRAIQKKYQDDPNFMVAGTSAGAMSVPKVIIERGIIEETILKRDLTISTGLGLIDGIIVDTHFIKRGRFVRLALAVALHRPDYTGIGLGEDGALMISNGNEAECIGSGLVMIVEGADISQTNADDATGTTPIAIENLKVHILVEGCKYLISEKKFIMSSPTEQAKSSDDVIKNKK